VFNVTHIADKLRQFLTISFLLFARTDRQSLSSQAPAYLADDIKLVADRSVTCNHQPTGHVSSHILITPLAITASLLSVRACGIIYRLTHDRTSATDNSNDNENISVWH